MSKLFLEATEILIWGVDTFPDGIDASDLADAERLAASPPDDAMIASIVRYGVRTPVPVRVVRYGKDRTRYYVAIDGRRRVLGTRAANKQLDVKGNEFPIKVPYYVQEDGGTAADPILYNGHRAENSPLVQGAAIVQHRARGTSREDLETLFGVSRVTLDNWARLTKLIPPAKAIAGTSALPWSEAYALAKLPAKAQAERLAAADVTADAEPDDDGEESDDGPVTPTRGPRRPRVTAKMRPAKLVRAFAEKLRGGELDPPPDGEQSVALAVLAWVLGGEIEGDFDSVREALP